MTVCHLGPLPPSFRESGCGPARLWVRVGGQGFPAPDFRGRVSGHPWCHWALGKQPPLDEKRKSEVCPWGGVASVRVSGHQGAWDPPRGVPSTQPSCASTGRPYLTLLPVCTDGPQTTFPGARAPGGGCNISKDSSPGARGRGGPSPLPWPQGLQRALGGGGREAQRPWHPRPGAERGLGAHLEMDLWPDSPSWTDKQAHLGLPPAQQCAVSQHFQKLLDLSAPPLPTYTLCTLEPGPHPPS